MICGVCAIGLHYLILKFLSVNLFLWGHELANSFLLFSVHKSFLQIIKKFSLRHRLHFLLALSYGLQVASTFHCTRNGFLASFRDHMYFDSSVSFLLFACRNESYVGLATNFKDRYRNHMTSFRHANRRNETELSKYIWSLKDARKPFRVQWKVLATCKPYDNVSKKCNLCLKENFFIICRNDLCTLNKRNELASSCPHRNRFTLKNFKIR